MAHSSGFYHMLIQVLNRKSATLGKFGVDASGIEWEDGDILHANVSFAKGKQAMNAGALDVYCVEGVRMRWTNKVTMRSRIRYKGKIYQIIPETFHEDFQDNTLQFHIQLVVNEK